MNLPPRSILSMLSTLILLLSLPSALPTQAEDAVELRLPALFSDGAVLLRESAVPVWGWAPAGAEVVLRADWLEAPLSATAGEDGRFELALETPEAGGPYTLGFESGGTRVEVADVLIGEVWLASGQSNMEWKIGQTLGAFADPEALRADALRPALRFFEVQNAIAMEPLEHCSGTWVPCSPEVWDGFGAVSYWFARSLQEELSVPIGIVSPEWGGTVVESWTSRETLAAGGEFDAALLRIDAALAAGENPDDVLARERARWWEAVEAGEAARAVEAGFGKASDVEFDDGAWSEVSLPGMWEGELADFDGVVWYRRSIDLPREWRGRGLALSLGPIDDLDATWFAGARVGGLVDANAWNVPRLYTVRGELVEGGRTQIAVRAVDTGGAGGFSGAPEALWIAPRDALDERISLAGTWRQSRGTPMAELPSYPRQSWFHANTPTALYNGMIAPVAPFAVRGAIWYQGESNVRRAAQYRRLFPDLIEDWRRTWGTPISFYYVQIAPFGYGGDVGQAAELREAQTLALAVPGSGMAVTMDIGNPLDIHPREKRVVGERLALWARARDYGQDVDCVPPLLQGHAVEGGAVRLSFGEGEELVAAPGGLQHFTIAGEDRVFHPAQAHIEGSSVLVSSADVPAPVAVRYAWGAADPGTLFDASGLPAPSFRTDVWERE